MKHVTARSECRMTFVYAEDACTIRQRASMQGTETLVGVQYKKGRAGVAVLLFLGAWIACICSTRHVPVLPGPGGPWPCRTASSRSLCDMSVDAGLSAVAIVYWREKAFDAHH